MTSTMQAYELLETVAHRHSSSRLGMMLYGSQARGTASQASDIDILELVTHRPSSYSIHNCNVTQYTEAHLASLASRGSLFVRHLVLEGHIFQDHDDRLSETLSLYREPNSYEPLLALIRSVAPIVEPELIDAERYASGIARLGVYLLRTTIYANRATAGLVDYGLDAEHESELTVRAMRLRKNLAWDLDDIGLLRAALLENLGPLGRMARSAESFAFSCVGDSVREQLLNSIFSERGALPYEKISLPAL